MSTTVGTIGTKKRGILFSFLKKAVFALLWENACPRVRTCEDIGCYQSGFLPCGLFATQKGCLPLKKTALLPVNFLSGCLLAARSLQWERVIWTRRASRHQPPREGVSFAETQCSGTRRIQKTMMDERVVCLGIAPAMGRLQGVHCQIFGRASDNAEVE